MPRISGTLLSALTTVALLLVASAPPREVKSFVRAKDRVLTIKENVLTRKEPTLLSRKPALPRRI